MDKHRAIFAEYGSKVDVIEAEIAAIEDKEKVNVQEIGSESAATRDVVFD